MKAFPAIVALVAAVAPAPFVRGDGGTVRLSGLSGPYRVAVLSSPEPLRVGPVDVSVVVQDAATGKQIDDLRVRVSLVPDGDGEALVRDAGRANSPTGLFLMASFELGRSGRWTLRVDIESSPGRTELEADLLVAPRPPRWLDLAGWIFAPVVPIALFVAREHRRSRCRSNASIGSNPPSILA